MAKVFFISVSITMMFNMLVSFSVFAANQKCRRYAEAEVRRAGAVFIMSVEEHIENDELMKTGTAEGLTADPQILFIEYDYFLKNCRYVRGEDVKIKILILEDAIWYFNVNNEELYAEAKPREKDDLAGRIKRQLLRVFPADEFAISPGLFCITEENALILIYENKYRNIGFTGEISNRYYYIKIKLES